MSVTINHYKSHTAFQLIPTSMTLNNFQRRKSLSKIKKICKVQEIRKFAEV